MDLIHELEKSGMKTDLPLFNVGDTVDVKTLIREGSKERTQTFTGVVIAIRGRGIRRNFTVRRIVHSMAKHDRVHLAQLERALAGQV